MKKLYILTAAVLLLFTGCDKNQEPAPSMTVSPTAFSAETRKVLEILDDEVAFFTCSADDSIRSMEIFLWFYEDGQWVQYGGTHGNDPGACDIALRMKTDTIDIIHIDDTGNSKAIYPNMADYGDCVMRMEYRLNTPETIETGKEIVLWYEAGTADTYSTVMESEADFRALDCIAGAAVTVVFGDTPIDPVDSVETRLVE